MEKTIHRLAYAVRGLAHSNEPPKALERYRSYIHDLIKLDYIFTFATMYNELAKLLYESDRPPAASIRATIVALENDADAFFASEQASISDPSVKQADTITRGLIQAGFARTRFRLDRALGAAEAQDQVDIDDYFV